MKKIEKLIPTAIDAVTDCKIKNTEDGTVPKEFNGYISSFGASMISAGLLPTIIFYSQKGESASERHKIIISLEYIIRKHFTEILEKDKLLVLKVKELIQKGASTTHLEEKIADAAIALKLAMRTFPKSKN